MYVYGCGSCDIHCGSGPFLVCLSRTASSLRWRRASLGLNVSVSRLIYANAAFNRLLSSNQHRRKKEGEKSEWERGIEEEKRKKAAVLSKAPKAVKMMFSWGTAVAPLTPCRWAPPHALQPADQYLLSVQHHLRTVSVTRTSFLRMSRCTQNDIETLAPPHVVSCGLTEQQQRGENESANLRKREYMSFINGRLRYRRLTSPYTSGDPKRGQKRQQAHNGSFRLEWRHFRSVANTSTAQKPHTALIQVHVTRGADQWTHR